MWARACPLGTTHLLLGTYVVTYAHCQPAHRVRGLYTQRLHLFEASCTRLETTSHRWIETNAAGFSDKPTHASTVLTMKRGGAASDHYLYTNCLNRTDRQQAVRAAESLAGFFRKVIIQVAKYEGLARGGLSLTSPQKIYNGPKRGVTREPAAKTQG